MQKLCVYRITCFILIMLLLQACSEVEFSNSNEDAERNLQSLEEGHLQVSQNYSDKDIDILIVIDNSISMLQEQEKLGQRFGDFISALRDTNWRIGFITTDARLNIQNPGFGGKLLNLNGASGNFIDKNTQNVQEVFLKTINRKSDQVDCGSRSTPCASNTEEPLKAFIESLLAPENTGFFRRNAVLATLILSDEDEMSYGEEAATKPNEVIASLLTLFGPKKRYTNYGFIIEPNDIDCLQENGQDGVYGTHVYELSQFTGGFTSSICDDDYASSLRKISSSVREKLVMQNIDLTHLSEVSQLRVEFTPQQNAVPWVYRDGHIHFETPPAEGTLIDVFFRHQK